MSISLENAWEKHEVAKMLFDGIRKACRSFVVKWIELDQRVDVDLIDRHNPRDCLDWSRQPVAATDPADG